MIDVAGRCVLGVPEGSAQLMCAPILDQYAHPEGPAVLHNLRLDDGTLIDHIAVSGTDVVVLFSSQARPKRRARRALTDRMSKSLGNVRFRVEHIDPVTCSEVAFRTMQRQAHPDLVNDLTRWLITPIRPTGLIAAGVPA